MHLTQFLILEAGPECNYADRHPQCPIKEPSRFSGLDTSRRLDEDTMVDLAVRAHREFGFRGLVGFHHYNEPMLYKDLILRVIGRVRQQVPHARFVLWSNGSLIAPDNAHELNAFDLAVITNYDQRDFSFLRPHVKRLWYAPVAFDGRRRLPPCLSRKRCVRLFTEFIVDCYGNVHICCIDWQGKASPGNVFTTSLAELVRRFVEVRGSIAGRQMEASAPPVCLTCTRRWSRIDRFTPEIKRDAQAAVAKLFE